MICLSAALWLLLTATINFGRAANAAVQSVSVNLESSVQVNGLQYTLADGAKVDAFLGIPYAKPPIGNLRFRPPVSRPSAVNESLDATKLPNTCFQEVDKIFNSKYVDMWNPNTNLSEDCLHLNIWRPAGGKQPKAVMVWIFGGGFSSGSSTLELYDGKLLAHKGDVIVVSMQYRVGPLGFLALGGDQTGAAGNAGLLDQQLALKWVQKNIGSFGGDPGRVTLFGESAGAASVSYHLLSSGSEKLFQRAILMSAAVTEDWNYVTKAQAAKSARHLAKLVRCNVSESEKDIMECLRKAKPADLTKNQWSVSPIGIKVLSVFRPTVDDNFLHHSPLELLRSGKHQKKKILVGNVLNEGSYFLPYMFPNHFHPDKNISITADIYIQLIRNLSILKKPERHVVNSVAFEYSRPCSHDGRIDWTPDYVLALDQLVGDKLFTCPVLNFARTYASYAERSKSDNSSVFVYTFNHRTSGNPWPAWFGAAHGYEIDHVFGYPLHEQHKKIYSDDERILSNQVLAYWTNFAKTGDPNTGDSTVKLPVWPEYTIRNRTVMALDIGSKLRIQNGLRERECDYWWTVVPQLELASTAGYQSQTIGFLWTIMLCLSARLLSH